MKLLNLGCGGDRPQDEHWTNLDTLRTFLKPGTPERTNLDKETNYVEWDLMEKLGVLFPGEPYDGILWQHGPEHFELHRAVTIAATCKDSLTPGGTLLVSAPDADYFMYAYPGDTRERAVELFGEPISEPEHATFMDYALFHREHKQVLNPSGIMAILYRAGFKVGEVLEPYELVETPSRPTPAETIMSGRLNRRKFSAILYARKP